MTTDRRFSPAAALVAIAAILLPLGYVLSTGPVVALAKKGYVSPDFTHVIYWPLQFLYDHWEPAKAFFDSYLHLWVP
jgi:hypothetical protein